MQIDRELLEKLESQYGSPFYLIEPEKFRKNFHDLLKAFRKYYPNTNIAYSYKTNYIPRFCQIVNELGGYAEVVSSMELELAKKIGVEPGKIYFNGPYKDFNALKTHLVSGGRVNVDSSDELIEVFTIAKEYPSRIFQIGLRCNFDVGDGVLSRFGFDLDNGSFDEALMMIDKQENVKLIGLHCHFATRTLSCWEKRTQCMISVLNGLPAWRLKSLKYVSLGGGLYGTMPDSMKAQFPFEIPDFDSYAAISAKPFADYIKKCGCCDIDLIIEPGTALVANAMRFICKVYSIKEIRGKMIVTLNGSKYNINPTPNRKNVPIKIYSKQGETRVVHNADFAGYTCIENDYLYRNYSGKLNVGDFVELYEVGAYSIVMKPPFILPDVAILEIGQDLKVVKFRETFDDVFNLYTFC